MNAPGRLGRSEFSICTPRLQASSGKLSFAFSFFFSFFLSSFLFFFFSFLERVGSFCYSFSQVFTFSQYLSCGCVRCRRSLTSRAGATAVGHEGPSAAGCEADITGDGHVAEAGGVEVVGGRGTQEALAAQHGLRSEGDIAGSAALTAMVLSGRRKSLAASP